MTASEAKEVGLANDVFPADTFEEDVKTRLEELSQHHPMVESIQDWYLNFNKYDFYPLCILVK